MNARNFSAGILVVVVGVILLFLGPQLILIPSTQTQVTDLFRNEAFTVGDIWERSVQLDDGVLVNGTVAVRSALTNEAAEIPMAVLDDANYQKWVAHGSPTYIFQKEISDGEPFLFTVPHSGIYHFLFDNTNSPVKKKVTLTAELQKQVTVALPDERIRYVAYGLIAVGVLIAVAGALRKTPVSWA